MVEQIVKDKNKVKPKAKPETERREAAKPSKPEDTKLKDVKDERKKRHL